MLKLKGIIESRPARAMVNIFTVISVLVLLIMEISFFPNKGIAILATSFSLMRMMYLVVNNPFTKKKFVPEVVLIVTGNLEIFGRFKEFIILFAYLACGLSLELPFLKQRMSDRQRLVAVVALGFICAYAIFFLDRVRFIGEINVCR